MEDIPEINVTMKSMEVKAHPRKLKGKSYGKNGTFVLSKYSIVIWWYKLWWSIFPPKETELNAYHSVDAEEEITQMLVDAIKNATPEEIDAFRKSMLKAENEKL